MVSVKLERQEKYNLTWHNYSDHYKQILRDLITTNNFSDVTLVTEDKQQIKAHKNIIGSCSPVFRNILQIDPFNNHPVIYLKGIQHFEMEPIIEFMYQGETMIFLDRMADLVSAVKTLEIIGLHKCLDTFNLEKETEASKATDITNINTEEKQDTKVETLERSHHAKYKGPKVNCEHCGKIFSDKHGLKQHIQGAHEGIKYSCDQCEYQGNQQGNLRQHIQSKHEGLKHTCQYCDQQFGTQGNLKIHMQGKHEGITFDCDKCKFKSSRKDRLKYHIQIEHEGVKKDIIYCDQCDKQFTSKKHLKVHQQSKHDGIKYSCDKCPKTYTQSYDLKKHIKVNHTLD